MAKKTPNGVTISAFLTAVVAATLANDPGYVFAGASDYQPEVDAGTVVVNAGLTDPSNPSNIAVRATQAGIDKVHGTGTQTLPAANAAPVSAPQNYAIATGYVMSARKRGNLKANKKYPFELLEVGQAFFVPATSAGSDPAKSLASTVASANRRFATEVEGQVRQNRKGKTVPVTKQSREFKIDRVEDGVVFGEQFKGVKGAAVVRVAVAA